MKKRLLFLCFLSLLIGGGIGGAEETTTNQSALLEEELAILLQEGTASSSDLDQLLRMAGIYLDLGYAVYDDRDKKLLAFQEGARVARKALDLRENSADAHFLYAANLGSAAELQGLVSGALTLQEIQHHVRRVLELDERYVQAHHMLGRLYEELPWFLGGDVTAAGRHLQRAVSLDERYAPARLDLAVWYLKQGQQKEAVEELVRVVETPPLVKRWMWEQIYRPKAQALLRDIAAEEGGGRIP